MFVSQISLMVSKACVNYFFVDAFLVKIDVIGRKRLVVGFLWKGGGEVEENSFSFFFFIWIFVYNLFFFQFN